MTPLWKKRPARPKAGADGPLRRRKAAQQPLNKPRYAIAMIVFCGVYALIGGRLMAWGVMPEQGAYGAALRQDGVPARPDLLDRNGEVLATDIRSASLFAEPGKIIDADAAVEKLSTVLPGLDRVALRNKLSGQGSFAWLKRDISPVQMEEIHALAIPGIGFRTENRRFYPGGNTASHVVGHVDPDNRGMAGMERYLDESGMATRQARPEGAGPRPVQLSVDLRVQHVVRDELSAAMERYKAIAAGGVVLDVETGEVVAMASLPDYDPNSPVDAHKKENLNRMTAGTFEMGSTFKTFTTAMALDSGKVKMTDSFDARAPIRIDGFTISDLHGQRRMLSVPEIFMYSSNIGTAREAELVGVEAHRQFLTRLGLLTRMQTELPEVAEPTQPDEWKKINSITISFGHGASTTPLQTAAAAAALMNGGYLVPPTFLPRSRAAADALKVPVVSRRTSEHMRALFKLNGERGSGRSAQVEGYDVGGKTGTAEKIVNGRYQDDRRFNAYLAAFPMAKPRYVVLVVLDEPQKAPGQPYATAGWNAAPTVAGIVRRAAGFLDVRPEFGNAGEQLLVSY